MLKSLLNHSLESRASGPPFLHVTNWATKSPANLPVWFFSLYTNVFTMGIAVAEWLQSWTTNLSALQHCGFKSRSGSFGFFKWGSHSSWLVIGWGFYPSGPCALYIGPPGSSLPLLLLGRRLYDWNTAEKTVKSNKQTIKKKSMSHSN